MTAVSAVAPALPTRSREVAVLLAFVTGIGLLLFAYRYLDVVTTGSDRKALDALICEMTGAYSGGLLFFAVRAVARRHRLDAPGGHRAVPVHLLALVAFGATATSLMWASRLVLFPLVGLGPYDYGRMPHRYFMEFPIQVIAYSLMVGSVYVTDRQRAQRERDLRMAQLESQLSQSRLQALELQLQPHFLFNALNTVSSTMYEDPAAADEMVGHLAELLRASLRADGRHEVPLREELEALGHYLSLMRARFGEGLDVRLDVESAALDLRVPSLILQPLVENAVRHGGVAAVGRGRVAVAARRDGQRLRLEVRDEGRAAAQGEGGTGLGLSLTRERLRLLYGAEQGFEAGPVEGGGFKVTLWLPARSARP